MRYHQLGSSKRTFNEGNANFSFEDLNRLNNKKQKTEINYENVSIYKKIFLSTANEIEKLLHSKNTGGIANSVKEIKCMNSDLNSIASDSADINKENSVKVMYYLDINVSEEIANKIFALILEDEFFQEH